MLEKVKGGVHSETREDDYTKAKSFCPITLTSHVFKTMDKVILNHLENVYEIHSKLQWGPQVSVQRRERRKS